jgi:hypothetical protein
MILITAMINKNICSLKWLIIPLLFHGHGKVWEEQYFSKETIINFLVGHSMG